MGDNCVQKPQAFFLSWLGNSSLIKEESFPYSPHKISLRFLLFSAGTWNNKKTFQHLFLPNQSKECIVYSIQNKMHFQNETHFLFGVHFHSHFFFLSKPGLIKTIVHLAFCRRVNRHDVKAGRAPSHSFPHCFSATPHTVDMS